MNIEEFYELCLSMKGATEHFPFDDDTLVFKVGGKIFCLTSLKSWEKETPSINLKCDPERAVELRATFQGIQPGFHMNKVHWNTVVLNDDVSVTIFVGLLKHSYDLVFKSLPKKVQLEIGN